MQRALAIDEASYGEDHPNVARDLNNLAGLLLATNRAQDAEPMYRRALVISVKGLSWSYPNSQTVKGHYVQLLQKMGLSEEAIEEKLKGLG